MPAEPGSDLKFEIGHVLFIDIVGYSKLLINEQSERIRGLKEIVRGTEQVRLAEAENKLMRLPTGDGMALPFRNSVEAPVQCALEISRALKSHPELHVRMGIHSGPVSEIADVNERANIAGAGINIAKRVMDCGDAGHILLSKHVAEDLEHYARWRPLLHDLGECRVKHGLIISVCNIYTDEVGNSKPPRALAKKGSRRPPAELGHRLPREHAISDKSIAVLAFENLSEDRANAYFAEGIQGEIFTRLSKIADLKVISRTSTQRFKRTPGNLRQIAKHLGVAHILEGSVQRAANQVRVNVQLINVATDSHVWAESFDRQLIDIFKVESDIAKNIADALQARLTSSEKQAIKQRPTVDVEAYQFYLKGKFFWDKLTVPDLLTAIEYFNQAIEKDPAYARAYAGLAECYCSLGFSFDAGSLAPKEAIPRAKAAALRAVEIDGTLAEAHTSLAFIKLNYDWDWSGAEKGFKRAIELNSNYNNAHHWYSHYLMAMGRTEESFAESERALEIDQLDLGMNVHLGWHYFYARQYDLAIDQFRKTLQLEPNYGLTHWYLGMALQAKANHREALVELETGRNLLRETVGVQAEMAHACAASGNRDRAQRLIDDLLELSNRRYVSSYYLALIYTGLGEKDLAFGWFEKALQERSDLLVYLKVDPRLDALRADPRFPDLLRQIGL